MKHGKIGSVFGDPDQAGCSFEGECVFRKMGGFGVAKDEIEDVGCADATTEVCEFYLDVFTMTDNRHGVADTVEPNAGRGSGLVLGALRRSRIARAATDELDGWKLIAAADKPREPMDESRIHHRIVDDE